MNILEELWNGQICPIEAMDYRAEEYRDLLLIYQRNENSLLPTLNAQQQTDLKKLMDVQEEMEQLAECAAFITGFRLAVQLMTAAV